MDTNGRHRIDNRLDVGYSGTRAVPAFNANALPWRTLRGFGVQRYERGHGGLDPRLPGKNAVNHRSNRPAGYSVGVSNSGVAGHPVLSRRSSTRICPPPAPF